MGGTWVALLVKWLTLDFDLDYALMVREIAPRTVHAGPAWDSLSPSLCPFPAHNLPLLSLYMNK